LECNLEEWPAIAPLASSIAHQSHPGQDYPEGCQRQAPFGGLVD
jgi:hypothetical protein